MIERTDSFFHKSKSKFLLIDKLKVIKNNMILEKVISPPILIF